MKKNFTIAAVFAFLICNAQVGINTTDPKATLDVNGNIMVRTTPPVAGSSSSYDFLTVDPVTKEVQTISGSLGTTLVDNTVAKAENPNGFTLLTVGLLGGFTPVRFNSAEINNGANFTVSTSANTPSFYTVPSSGIYQIKYELRLGNGLKLELITFTGTPGIAIIKNTGGTSTILDRREFSGVNVGVIANLNITNSTINNIYRLVQGDQISFGFNNGGIDLGLLTSSLASVNIRKISD